MSSTKSPLKWETRWWRIGFPWKNAPNDGIFSRETQFFIIWILSKPNQKITSQEIPLWTPGDRCPRTCPMRFRCPWHAARAIAAVPGNFGLWSMPVWRLEVEWISRLCPIHSGVEGCQARKWWSWISGLCAKGIQVGCSRGLCQQMAPVRHVQSRCQNTDRCPQWELQRWRWLCRRTRKDS